MVYPEVLILGSRFDFSCDYVITRLRRLGVPYLRLNSEDYPEWELTLDPVRRLLNASTEGLEFVVTPDRLRSVWFRRACYPRDYSSKQRSIGEQIARSQWAAFTRSLMIFSEAFWINNPASTYRAEQKALQLSVAASVGFVVPETLFTNTSGAVRNLPGSSIVVKGIDTVIGYEGDCEHFGFANTISKDLLQGVSLSQIPITAQRYVDPKVDIRATVVNSQVFCAEILKGISGVPGDWRALKEGLEYRRCTLPTSVEQKCVELTKRLDLSFGGIDLTRQGNDYSFLEINPTGEWAWLVDAAGLPIDEAIANALSS